MTFAYEDYIPTAYEQLSVSSSAVGLTASKYKPAQGHPANLALIRCSTANVRWRDDGTDPTASVGVPLNAGEILNYEGDLSKVKFIRQSADATLDVAYGLGVV